MGIEEVVWALNSHDRLQCTLIGAILPGQGVFDFERCFFWKLWQGADL